MGSLINGVYGWGGQGVGLGGDNEEHDNDRDPDGEGNVRVSWDFWHSVRSLGGWGIFFRADTNFGAFVLSGPADGIRTVVVLELIAKMLVETIKVSSLLM